MCITNLTIKVAVQWCLCRCSLLQVHRSRQSASTGMPCNCPKGEEWTRVRLAAHLPPTFYDMQSCGMNEWTGSDTRSRWLPVTERLDRRTCHGQCFDICPSTRQARTEHKAMHSPVSTMTLIKTAGTWPLYIIQHHGSASLVVQADSEYACNPPVLKVCHGQVGQDVLSRVQW